MEIVLALFALLGGSIAFSAWKKKKAPDNSPPNEQHDAADNGQCYRK